MYYQDLLPENSKLFDGLLIFLSAPADRRGERKYQGAAGPHRPEARRSR
uniref:Uncharacterized protein n=1 Tax=Escherichia coli TaxID=562 RepID=A0A7D5G3H7_ECOLX|nr:hypothetical protein [Escherichia coli]